MNVCSQSSAQGLRRVKTAGLVDLTLDWAAAKCAGQDEEYVLSPDQFELLHASGQYRYSSDWDLGGPIIEQSMIQTSPSRQWLVCHRDHRWASVRMAHDGSAAHLMRGPTVLVAARRCLVLSRLGAEVDVPEALCDVVPSALSARAPGNRSMS